MADKIPKEKETFTLWVPSHIGIYGNERADNLAKTEAKNLQ